MGVQRVTSQAFIILPCIYSKSQSGCWLGFSLLLSPMWTWLLTLSNECKARSMEYVTKVSRVTEQQTLKSLRSKCEWTIIENTALKSQSEIRGRLKPLKESISHVSLRQHTPNASCSRELEIFYQLPYKQLTPPDQGQSPAAQSLSVRRH